ncbi:phosphatidylglycerol:prolipoprotein diacylglycerol transferase [Rhizobium sp. NFR07]|uniref:prolipoprotein diacylglyceryl transferase n=1 Tax=Rhizobium sp. NFR07 TaxID=1566262 RepID=UPI0008ECFC3D|nr:prolipoprotein diacylglyceryl transferase [Rhizobium sp. NFR07]SFB45164.1 phosphatidylglycerol:prolipoprotein diacylglycerol transferase [Rhizobium sp. NFR07]
MYEAIHLLAILPFPNIDPVAFSIGPLKIHWYGLAYVAGILLGWFYACKLVDNDRLWPNDKAPLTRVHLDDFLIWITAGIVLGGRIGYVLFYDFPKYQQDPISVFQIWDGGMAFHGGLIGSTIAMFVFARRNGIPVWSMFDTIAAVAPIGIFFGRIANFINGELWGRLSDVPWAVVFPTGGLGARHPSQLYEAALEGVLLAAVIAILIFGFKALRKPGLVTGVFVAGYAVSRIIVEFVREPDRQVGYQFGTDWITRGMTLSVPMVALGLWAAARAIVAARKARH